MDKNSTFYKHKKIFQKNLNPFIWLFRFAFVNIVTA